MWVENFEEFESILDKEALVVVDFTAPGWCVPCQRFAPHFDKAAENSDAIFVAVDVDKAPWAAVEYGIRGVPTVKLYRNGGFVSDLKERTAPRLLNEIASYT